MSKLIIPAIFALTAITAPALASNGGDRTPAGGAFMSSYANPSARAPEGRSLWNGFAAEPSRDVPATGSVERRRANDRR